MLVAVGIDLIVVDKASRQGGYITRVQLLELGMSSDSIDRRIGSGDFVVVGRGVYNIIRPSDHMDLLRGAILLLPDATVSHESAAHLLKFPRVPRLEPTVTVHSRTTHEFPGVTVRRCSDLTKSHLTKVDGIPVTHVARTVFDLAGVLEFAEFDLIVESLVIAGRLKIRHLDRMIGELARRGKRGATNARRTVQERGLAPLVDPTVLERMGRAVLDKHGIPAPLSQYPIPWDPAHRFDDAYPTPRVAIEWDSRSWHSQRAAMEKDRERDRDAAIHGWVLVRFTWTDVTKNPRGVADSVASLLKARSE